MPFAAKAMQSQAPANLMPPMPAGGAPMPPPAAMGAPAPTGPPPAAMPPQGGMPSLPPSGAPAAPYTVRLQPDGSSVYVMPSPDGNPANDIILSVNAPPKLPKALQPPAPQAQ